MLAKCWEHGIIFQEVFQLDQGIQPGSRKKSVIAITSPTMVMLYSS